MSEHIRSIYSDAGMSPLIWGGSGYALLLTQYGIQFGTATTSPRVKSPAPVAMAANDVDWSLGETFTKSISSNTTFTFSNVRAGEIILIRVLDTNTSTLTWPAGVKWPSAAAPVQTVTNKNDIYIIWAETTSVFYGAYWQNYS